VGALSGFESVRSDIIEMMPRVNGAEHVLRLDPRVALRESGLNTPFPRWPACRWALGTMQRAVSFPDFMDAVSVVTAQARPTVLDRC
jgi:hypothetical protein